MKKLLLILPLIFSSCERTEIVNHQGHRYIKFFHLYRSYGIVHDPECPKCKAALHENNIKK